MEFLLWLIKHFPHYECVGVSVGGGVVPSETDGSISFSSFVRVVEAAEPLKLC